MQSVGIMTVHQSVNCGASLQAYALYRTIEELGATPTIINYCPKYFMSYMDDSRIEERRSLRGRIKTALIGDRLTATRDQFLSFGNTNYPRMTKRVNAANSLNHFASEFDCIVCGSDQIWNPPHVKYDDSWMLDFAKQSDTVLVSYAASIGKDHLSDKDMRWLAEGMLNFDHIGIREESGVKIAEDLGFHATHCVDPTLLRTKEEWKGQLSVHSGRRVPNKFIFYYPIEENNIESSLLFQLKKMTGLKCVALTDSFRKPKYADIQISGFSPRDFLDLVHGSTVVFTNSFHGLVFSLIFGKTLVSYKNETKNSRLESMFRSLRLDDYQVSSVEDLAGRDLNVDRERFISSYENISGLIASSKDFLFRSISRK